MRQAMIWLGTASLWLATLCTCFPERRAIPAWRPDGTTTHPDAAGTPDFGPYPDLHVQPDKANPPDPGNPPDAGNDQGQPPDCCAVPDGGPELPDAEGQDEDAATSADEIGQPDGDGQTVPDQGPESDTQGPTECLTVPNAAGGPTWLRGDSCPVPLPAPVARTNGPEDWRDEILYFLLIDRFDDGDSDNNETRMKDDGTPLHNPNNIGRYHGGDLEGVRNRIAYLRTLGVTALWLTPIVLNTREDDGRTGYAGYWAYDLTKADPHWISVQDPNNKQQGREYFRDFVDELHENGLLVVQDIVVNHMGNLALYRIGGQEQWNPNYNDAGYGSAAHLFIENSSYGEADWVEYGLRKIPPAPFDDPAFYHNCGRDDGNVKGDPFGLDDLATERSDVRNALIEVYSAWVRDAHVDGFRLDTVKNVEPEFWTTFSPAIRDVVQQQWPGRRFLQFGEVYDVSHASSGSYLQSPRLDSLLNFDFYKVVKGVFLRGLDTHRLATELQNRAALRAQAIGSGGGDVSASAGAINFIDNHDYMRFMMETDANAHKLRAALMYMLTTTGMPCIYYNTENEVRGATGDGEGGRVDMPDFSTTGKLTFTLIRKLAQIRREHVALRRGEVQVLADRNAAGLFAFARKTEQDADDVFVALNTSGNAINETIELPAGVADGTVLTDVLRAAYGDNVSVTVSGGSIDVSLQPYSAAIFAVQ